MSRYTRTRGGRVIHVTGCRHAANGTPWLWADEQPDTTVLASAETLNYQLCGQCKPLDGISRTNLHGQIAAAITDGLLNGLPHPHRDDTALTLAQFRTAGMPEHFAKATIAIAEAIGQAVVKLIENRFDATIVSNSELVDIRRTQSDSTPRVMSVRCQHRELFRFILAGDETVIDCGPLRDNLGDCAHDD
jgi:hypothetical protein